MDLPASQETPSGPRRLALWRILPIDGIALQLCICSTFSGRRAVEDLAYQRDRVGFNEAGFTHVFVAAASGGRAR